MNGIQIIRTNGNVPKSLPGEDHISGFMCYMATLPTGFSETNRIQLIGSVEKAESLGITAEAATWDIKVLHYHLTEIFRLNDGITLYVGIFAKPASTYTFTELKQMQNFCGGKLRQVAIYCGSQELKADIITAISGVATSLEDQDRPLSVLYAPKVSAISSMPTNIAASDMSRVSVVISQSGSDLVKKIYTDATNTALKASVSDIGTVLGLLSRSSVHESISWVGRFPSGISSPGFGDGTLLNTLDRAVIEGLDAARYLFFVTYTDLVGSYLNDSHTMDEATSDYAMIENVRTMDKAARGVRRNILPELGRSLYIDTTTGKLQSYTVKHLETVANKALEDMEKAGELSGFIIEIDPDQNVLSTSTVEFVIRPVGVGVMRKVKIKFGYTNKI